MATASQGLNLNAAGFELERGDTRNISRTTAG